VSLKSNLEARAQFKICFALVRNVYAQGTAAIALLRSSCSPLKGKMYSVFALTLALENSYSHDLT
jgi:hypothetical protein